MVDVKLSKTELRKKDIVPTCKDTESKRIEVNTAEVTACVVKNYKLQVCNHKMNYD